MRGRCGGETMNNEMESKLLITVEKVIMRNCQLVNQVSDRVKINFQASSVSWVSWMDPPQRHHSISSVQLLVSLKILTALLLLLELSTSLPIGPISSDLVSEILQIYPVGSPELPAVLELVAEKQPARRKRQSSGPPFPRSVIFETCARICMSKRVSI